jgi:hypothetical protein
MNLFTKLKSNHEQAPAVQKNDCLLVAPNTTQIRYAVFISNEKGFRICRDLNSLETTLCSMIEGKLNSKPVTTYDYLCDLVVCVSEKAFALPADYNRDAVTVEKLGARPFIKVSFRIANTLYMNGYCTPGYLLAWTNLDFTPFDDDFLNMMGMKGNGGTYRFSTAELGRYLSCDVFCEDHSLMLSHLEALQDADSEESSLILDCLSNYANESNADKAVKIVDCLAESAAFSGSLGPDKDQLGIAKYLAELDLDELTPFQNIYVFVYRWQLNFRKSRLDTDRINGNMIEERTLKYVYSDKPAPLWSIRREKNNNEEINRLNEILSILSQLCSKIENRCTLTEGDEHSFDEIDRILDAALKSEGLSDFDPDKFAIFDYLGKNEKIFADFQHIAGKLLESEKIREYPDIIQHFLDRMVQELVSMQAIPSKNYLTLENIRSRMPGVDKITRLYILVESLTITGQIDYQSEEVAELQKKCNGAMVDGNEDVVFSLKLEDAENILELLKKREMELLEISKQLEEIEQADNSRDAEILRRIAAEMTAGGVTLSDTDKKVLHRYGVVFLTIPDMDITGMAAGLKKKLDFLAETLDVFLLYGCRFYGWGILPSGDYRPSLQPFDYVSVHKTLTDDSIIAKDCHLIFINDKGEYFNEYNYIRGIGLDGDDYQDDPVRYKDILNELREKHAERLMGLFESRDCYRQLCGSSLTKDGLADEVGGLIQITSSLLKCSSIIQREMLEKSHSFKLDKLSKMAAHLLEKLDGEQNYNL